MNSSTYRFVITPEGKAFREDTQLHEINLTADVAEHLAAAKVTKLPSLFPTRWGAVGLTMADSKNYYWTFPLATLPLKAPFRTVSGLMVPNFGAGSIDPVLSMEWKVPPDMRLRMVVWTAPHRDYKFMVQRGFLFALDANNALYRLPLGNLYDDGRMCLGEGALAGECHFDACMRAMNQLQNGQWNADLWTTTSETQCLFRFKPTDKGFDQVDPERHWSSFSIRIGNSIASHITH